MSEQAQALARGFSAGCDPLEVALRPGNLSVVFQPIIDLRPRSRLLHGVECLARGPLGTPLEGARALFEYVRSRGAEIGVDKRTEKRRS